jgi:phosphatidate cytidylyltransferase
VATTDDESGLAPSPPHVPSPESPTDPVPVTDPPPPQTRNRAGRNLPAAVGVGVGLVLLVLVCLYVQRVAFVALATAASAVAVWELSNALASGGIRVPRLPVLVGGAAMTAAAYARGVEGLVTALGLTVLAVLLWRLPEDPAGYLRDAAAGVFVCAYVPFLVGVAVLLLGAEDGADRIVVFILVAVCSDVGGYAAGVFLGRHPMAPTVSPKKSWEGFAGSVLACTLVGAVAAPLLVDAVWWQGALLGLAAACSATLGDLGESMVKRDLGIKDMGSLLPGHGGLMDRLDSLLLTAPVAFFVLTAALGPA